MALTTSTVSHHQVRNEALGRVVTDAATAADTTFTVGFSPRIVRFINLTDRITLEWYEGMAADSAIMTVAAGTRTLITTEGITANATLNGFSVKAASIPASKVFSYEAVG